MRRPVTNVITSIDRWRGTAHTSVLRVVLRGGWTLAVATLVWAGALAGTSFASTAALGGASLAATGALAETTLAATGALAGTTLAATGAPAETTLAATGASARPAFAAEKTDSLEIRFVGNSGFELYDGETTLFVDLPYRSGAYQTMRYDPKSLKPRGQVVCLITHSHVDHYDVRTFRRADWRIIAPKTLTKPMPADRVIPIKLGIPVGRFVIAPYKTPHAGREHFSYVVGWKGRKLYFSGDTDDPTNLLEQTGLDIAFVTPWLSCKVVQREGTIDAEKIVLHHHSEAGDDDTCQEVTIMEQGEVMRLGPAEDYEGES